jgi:hypothetical protein
MFQNLHVWSSGDCYTGRSTPARTASTSSLSVDAYQPPFVRFGQHILRIREGHQVRNLIFVGLKQRVGASLAGRSNQLFGHLGRQLPSLCRRGVQWECVPNQSLPPPPPKRTVMHIEELVIVCD